MEKTVTVNGIPVFYREKGEGDTILILHGWRSSSDSWRMVQDFLAQKNFRVIVPDLPGFGKTPEPPEPWSVNEYTDFVEEFRKEIDIQPRSVLGHSFGGRIAIFYAIKYGKDLPTLVLCDAAGVFSNQSTRVLMYRIFTKIGDTVMSLAFLRFLKPLVRKIWYRFTREDDYYLTSGVMRETFKLVIEEPLRSHLEFINTSTLILWGEKDMTTPLSDAYILNEEIPVSYLHVFPSVGHAINLEIPEKVARQVSLFLKR